MMLSKTFKQARKTNKKSADDWADSVTLVNFGSAYALEKMQLTVTDRLGSEIPTCLEYAAPEVIKHNEYSPKTDIWSIGIVAFTLLSGSFPFFSDNKYELMDQIETCLPHYNHEDWTDVSAMALLFVKRILKFDPEKRLDIRGMLADPWIVGLTMNYVPPEALRKPVLLPPAARHSFKLR